MSLMVDRPADRKRRKIAEHRMPHILLPSAGVPVTAIRELRVLQSCKHPNVVRLKKVVTASKPDR